MFEKIMIGVCIFCFLAAGFLLFDEMRQFDAMATRIERKLECK